MEINNPDGRIVIAGSGFFPFLFCLILQKRSGDPDGIAARHECLHTQGYGRGYGATLSVNVPPAEVMFHTWIYKTVPAGTAAVAVQLSEVVPEL